MRFRLTIRPPRAASRALPPALPLTALLAGLLVLPAGTAAAQGATAVNARVDAIFAPHTRADAPGCAVGVTRGEALVYARGYGSANLDYQVPLSPRSVFYLASVSKQFTAAAVALAARQGRLSLDDDIRKWLPELRDYGTPITVRHLVHHTSGLRDYLTLLPLAGRRVEDVLTDQSLLELVARQRALNFAPGAEFLYSNTGYVLLAEIVKRATGMTLRRYADEQLFRPLGMRSTHFHDDAGAVVPGRVIGYRRDTTGWRIDHFFNFDKVGDGGLYSTIEDLAKWEAHFDHPRIGGAGFVAQLHERGVLAGGDTLQYAFGLSHGRHRGLATVEHGGSLAGFRTMTLRFPESRLSVVVLCNDGGANATRLARRVAEVYLGDRLQPEAPATVATAPARATGTAGSAGTAGAAGTSAPAAAPLASYAGTYASDELGTTWTIHATDTALEIARPDGRRARLRADAPDLFVPASGAGPTLRFMRDGERVTGFQLDAGRVRGIGFVRQP